MTDNTEDIANQILINGTYRDNKKQNQYYKAIGISRDWKLCTQRDVILEQLDANLFSRGTYWAVELTDFLKYLKEKRFTLAGRVLDVEQLNKDFDKLGQPMYDWRFKPTAFDVLGRRD